MKQISFCDCKVIDDHVLVYKLTKDELLNLFPFEFVDELPLAAPEPSIVAAVSLENGYVFGLIYGLISERLGVSPPLGIDTAQATLAFLNEAKMASDKLIYKFTTQPIASESKLM